ncbi:hypothetical protein K458DRAFT_437862 [Lentithecium fluviatile CBS 122367]|uniref:Lysine-specific metallo-endopeptidase domain-containing protein n=1 Tax=Lentithecium fluviatile CBS 122367 TaxID=1168545 RepID=A0A6G1IBL7_9PLEO|nr:hypothetical protein K458DRAFT_437862 [Lentithecium fluviatile CBS 122367]
MAFANRALALTYWIDGKSCTGDRSLAKAMEETKYMGAKASERLRSSTDTDFQNVYEFLMKRKKSDKSELDTIEGFMSDVGKMTEVNDRNSANVRIYCDDEQRWKPRLDPKTKQKTGGYEDPDNWIQYSALSIFSYPGCHDTRGGNRFTYAQSYKTYMAGEPLEKQADLRATITMCELGLLHKGKRRRVFSELDEKLDLTKASGVEVLKFHPSKVILHELSHYHGYNTIDNGYFIKPDGPGTTIRQLNAEELMKNADVRSYLGQMAILADKGYTFQRKPLDSAPQREKDAWNANMEIGKLFLYPNLTKRSLKRRMERLARRYNKV